MPSDLFSATPKGSDSLESDSLGNDKGQQALHQKLTEAFHAAHHGQDLDRLMQFVHHHLPDLLTAEPVEVVATTHENRFSLTTSKVSLTVTPDFGLRLYYQGRELTTHADHIPAEYPWFKPDPADLEDIAGFASRHVARGSRGESPWPEDQWPQVGCVVQGKQNWPHRDVAFGPYQLALINALNTASSDKATVPAPIQQPMQTRAVSLSQLNPDQPNAYGVINRGLFAVTPSQGIVLTLQLENRVNNGLSWSPWFVLGFAMPAQGTICDPSALVAWPADEDSDPAICGPLRFTWNYRDVDGCKVVLINPHSKTLNEPFKKLYTQVNWSVIGIKGTDYVVLTRSVLRHPEQYFPFLEHGRYFVEVEHTGPRAAAGETSTVIVRQDVLPLAALTQGQLQQFSDTRFEAEMTEVMRLLVQRDRAGQLVR